MLKIFKIKPIIENLGKNALKKDNNWSRGMKNTKNTNLSKIMYQSILIVKIEN